MMRLIGTIICLVFATAGCCSCDCKDSFGVPRDRCSPPPPGAGVVNLPFAMRVGDTLTSRHGGAIVDLYVNGDNGRHQLHIMARGSACAKEGDPLDWPILEISLDGQSLQSLALKNTTVSEVVSAPFQVPSGPRHLVLRFTNDFFVKDKCERSVLLQSLAVLPAP